MCVDASARAAAPDGTGANPFPTVGTAIAAAGPFATIQIAAGVYQEAVVLTGAEGLSLIGGFVAGGDFSRRDPSADATVLDGNDQAPVIDVVASSGVRIEGLRITGGGGHSDGSNWSGGGISIDQDSTNVTIAGNRLDGNAVDHGADPGAARGGAIYSDGKVVTIIDNVVQGNRAGRGAGIAAFGKTTIERNTVRDNVSVGDHGGGLYLAGEPTVIANRVEGNRVGTEYSWGGGIIVFGDDTHATLRSNVITDNLAITAGSGLFVDDGADATLSNELYYANRCASDGGAGVLVDSGGQTPTALDATNVTIAQHVCPDSYLGGNAVLVEVSQEGDPPPEVTIRNSILWGNGGSDLVGAGSSAKTTFTLTEQAIDGEGNLRGDPGFVDPQAGDFHLRSGSPAIDAGDPAAGYAAEPDPNGGRLDLGHTGNTAEAT